MDFKRISKSIIFWIAILVILLLLISIGIRNVDTGSKECASDSDCVVYGKSGSCNCGCYNDDSLPWLPTWGCYCIPSPACGCKENICSAVEMPHPRLCEILEGKEKEECYSEVIEESRKNKDKTMCEKINEEGYESYKEMCFSSVIG
jgi:hypothetical protein